MRINSKCPRCAQPLVWAQRADGTPIALDAVAPNEGTIRIGKDGVAVVGALGTGHYRPHKGFCVPGGRN